MDDSVIVIKKNGKPRMRVIYSDDSDSEIEEENSYQSSSDVSNNNSNSKINETNTDFSSNSLEQPSNSLLDLTEHKKSTMNNDRYNSESDEEHDSEVTKNSNYGDVHHFLSDDETNNKTDAGQSQITDSQSNISSSSQNAVRINISMPNESIIEPVHNLSKHNETIKSNKNYQDLSILNSSNEYINSSLNNTDIFIPETDEEDYQMESRCFSPRTRQSIGIKNFSGYSSDSDDDSNKEETENPSEMDENLKAEVIETLSTSNNVLNSSVISLSSSDGESQQINTKPPKPKLIQQKITNYTPQKINIKYVSQEIYDAELQEIATIKSDLIRTKDLIKTLSKGLPDKGASLTQRVSVLENNLEKKTEYLKTIAVKTDDGDEEGQPKRKSKSTGVQNVVDDWSKITEAINAIQPKHTGRVGLNTFNNQKALTVDRLRQLHASLETCPSEATLAIPPKGLRIDLMDHQKHALAWMVWREKQKPKGGILADDMGLGKTLTMISLVLEMRQREDNNEDQVEEESSDDDDETDEEQQQNFARGGRRPDMYQGGTLVVCPASLINQWEKEVENRLKRNLLAVCVHHGNKRDVKPKYLSKNDMVITTYAIVSRECKTTGPLFQIKWQRIILDEAHIIRNYKSQQSLACCQLKGNCRWTLTGTPIQNKEMDLFALLKFLRCSPFNDLDIYKKWIGNNSEGAQDRLNNLIKPLLLRRTKQKLQETGELESLPTKDVIIMPVKLNKDEMNVYQRIMSYSKTLFSQFLHQRAAKENDMFYLNEGYKPTYLRANEPNAAYDKMHQKMSKFRGTDDIRSHQILLYILRLRQICCHPGLIDAMLEDDNSSDEVDLSIPEIDLLEQLNKLNLNGSNNTNEVNKSNSFDEAAISKASSKLLLRSNPVFDLSRASAKFIAVLDLIKKEILPLDEKAVIVSQWTSVLNLLETHLQQANIPFVKLSGDVQVCKRNDLVVDFNKSTSKVKIMLLSLTAGGVGLNLVGGNHLLLLDPHWNPQLEAQAQDRIYRFGQTKPVKIYKFLCQETIEERINLLQQSKLRMANDLLNGVRHQGSSKLSLDDMKALFGM